MRERGIFTCPDNSDRKHDRWKTPIDDWHRADIYRRSGSNRQVSVAETRDQSITS